MTTPFRLFVKEREDIACALAMKRKRKHDEMLNSEGKLPQFDVKLEGTPVPSSTVKRAGPYLLGPTIGNSPVKSIVQCLARLEGTDKYYTLKILTLKDQEEECQDDRQGKMLIHTEYSLLSLLHDMENIIHHHGFFKDRAMEEKACPDRKLVYTGRVIERACLVLDCLVAHDYAPHSVEYINLQHYVIREKKLCEREAALILFNAVKVVHILHERNVVHRDLKLGNLVLHQSTHKVIVANFCLGKHLVSENDTLKDQRGSPAYISPDVLSGKPYLGKPSDMWALGVVLFTMLYGQFPFYDSSPTQLFTKIKIADYAIPNDGRVSENMISLIRNLLLLNPLQRLKTDQVLDALSTILATTANILMDEPLQVVPEYDEKKEKEKEEKAKEGKSVEVGKDPFSEFLANNTAGVYIRNITEESRGNRGLPERRIGGQISVHRVGEDARGMCQSELCRFRHLLPPGMVVDPPSSPGLGHLLSPYIRPRDQQHLYL
ncbi:unnamed protein product [Nezara viridula]|uniref:Serine/threonine-protein kinase 40 n=1 Tax=Nezara viridula TaxID=85310 RepID=A0A9P0E859_NEZVI|nr:unnamed protein product [Nezara viridula]